MLFGRADDSSSHALHEFEFEFEFEYAVAVLASKLIEESARKRILNLRRIEVSEIAWTLLQSPEHLSS